MIQHALESGITWPKTVHGKIVRVFVLIYQRFLEVVFLQMIFITHILNILQLLLKKVS